MSINIGDLGTVTSAGKLWDMLYDAQALAQDAQYQLQYDGLSDDEYKERDEELSDFINSVEKLREYIGSKIFGKRRAS